MAKQVMTAVEAEYFLSHLGEVDDCDIDLFEASLAFAFSDLHDVDIEKYRNHFQSMVRDLSACFDTMAGANNSDDVRIMASCLSKIFVEQYDYRGDQDTYDDLTNVNMMQVIDRRIGMPITLSILAIELSRAQGWNAQGINFPEHFLVCLEKEGDRIILDPFHGCRVMEAKDLRILIKDMMGKEAELSATDYEPCDNREILLRLQNNIKYRLIEVEDYQEALRVVMRMGLVAPNDHRIHLDKAVLFARLDQTQSAIDNIEKYLTYDGLVVSDRMEAEDFLSQMRSRLN